ncbi:serine/threonine protein kinase [Cystobacter fuscus]|uniref:serine/threonine protein kinase n=1 Tax=Cystobacter fuscus TaxID=43 RepID=UPI002B2AB3B5|nr:serine/threonine protein kinase [Cystobacter fuscus]
MAPVAPRAPVPFGQYQLLERIAVGGMAELFLAHQSGPDGFDKPVVIKRIRSELSKQPAFVRMFLNEARLAAQLNHPNIVQIHDLGKVEDSYFIAMEYLFGRDTRKVVPMAESLGISFPMVYALKIASSVCEGLHYAHQKVDLYGSPLNIVHRDVTPENIFVCFDGTVKVLDFGIAKATNRAQQTTRAGELRGKLSYLSPEQCLGKPVDHRSDLFSLGAVLYEWLTGFQLFSGDSEVAVMRGIVEGKVYAPSYFRADIPEPVEAILMKALERDRDKRYPSAWHFQQDLDRFLNAYDFTPTHVHLSNFLKQLFLRELEEEQERLRSVPRTTQEQVPASDSPSGGEHVLPVPVSAAQLEQLEAMARRNNVPVTRMVGEVLSAWLKYR